MGIGEQLAPLLGSWTGLERQEASPWAPAAEARASFVFRRDVGDTVVVQDYRQVRHDGGELTGHGVFQGSPAADEVVWWFFDSYGQPPVPARGAWRDGELVLEKTTATGSARHRWRAAGDELDYAVTVRLGDATTWSDFLRGRYRRVSGH